MITLGDYGPSLDKAEIEIEILGKTHTEIFRESNNWQRGRCEELRTLFSSPEDWLDLTLNYKICVR